MPKFSLVLSTAVTLALAAAGPAAALPTISASTTVVLYNGTTGNDTSTLMPLFNPPRVQLAGTATPGANCATSGANIICSMTGSDVEMHGDAGDDELYDGIYTAGVSRVYGDAGSDHLYATSNTTWAYAGDGNDVSTTGANGGGANYGEDGNDILITKSMSLVADGGAGDDLVILNSSAYPGNAYGQAGEDRVVGLRPGGTLNGGDDDDILAFSTATGSFLFAGAVLHGNGGADRLYGSAEPDTVYGEAGDDLVNTYGDGQVDTVDCGADTDTAYVDAIDTTVNCETVVVGSAAPSDPQVSGAISDAVADAAAAWNAVTPLP